MRFARSFQPSRHPGQSTRVLPAPVPDIASWIGPPASTDALHWATRRAEARRAEWRAVVATIETLVAALGANDRLVARAFADMERRGEFCRRHVSPAMSAEGLALWWLRVGRRPARRGRLPRSTAPSERSSVAGPA